MRILPSGDGSVIEMLEGTTFVREIGGPPVYVVRGGPGFDHSCLIEPLRALAERRTLGAPLTETQINGVRWDQGQWLVRNCAQRSR